MLGPAPAPELPPLEYARRPFELTTELLLGLPSCAGGQPKTPPCDGISAGTGIGASALWRPSPYFAFGATFDTLGFAFHPAPASGLRETRANGRFFGLLGRVYFFDHGQIEPYLELGLGSGEVGTSAHQADTSYEDSASGVTLRTGGALEFYLGRQVRLGPAFDWTHLAGPRVRRCAGSSCIDLNETSDGHGTGFSNVSLRLSILLGPGL